MHRYVCLSHAWFVPTDTGRSTVSSLTYRYTNLVDHLNLITATCELHTVFTLLTDGHLCDATDNKPYYKSLLVIGLALDEVILDDNVRQPLKTQVQNALTRIDRSRADSICADLFVKLLYCYENASNPKHKQQFFFMLLGLMNRIDRNMLVGFSLDIRRSFVDMYISKAELSQTHAESLLLYFIDTCHRTVFYHPEQAYEDCRYYLPFIGLLLNRSDLISKPDLKSKVKDCVSMLLNKAHPENIAEMVRFAEVASVRMPTFRSLETYLPMIKKEVSFIHSLTPLPRPQEQLGPNCGFYAASIATFFYHNKDRRFKGYKARKCEAKNNGQESSLRQLGKRFGIAGPGAIFNCNDFAFLDKFTEYETIITKFDVNDFGQKLEDYIKQQIPIILPVDYGADGLQNKAGRNAHYILICGFYIYKNEKYFIFTTHGKYEIATEEKLFNSSVQLQQFPPEKLTYFKKGKEWINQSGSVAPNAKIFSYASGDLSQLAGRMVAIKNKPVEQNESPINSMSALKNS